MLPEFLKGVFGLYARVSTRDQLDGMSIEAQLNALREWALAHGYPMREFIDAGKSAWTEDLRKRPAFKEMMDAARAGEIAGIVVTHLDRFSRKVLVTLSALGELGKLGVGFVSLENSSFDFSRPADRLMLTVLGAFAEYYSAELSRKIRRGLETRASKGLKVGLLPFGFVKDDNGNVVLDAHDAPGVVRAFEAYRATGVSFNAVADVLNADGFRSRASSGARVLFNKHSVDEMLCNPMYAGVVSFKGREIPGTFPAIISRELFDEVQTIRQSRRKQRYTAYKRHAVYLLNGIVTCSGCGRVMRAQSRTERGVTLLYYHCTTNELKGACTHKSAWINERELVPQIESIIGQFRLPENWLEVLNEMIAANGKPKSNGDDRAKIKRKLVRIADLYELGDMQRAEYIVKRDELKRQLASTRQPEVETIIKAEDVLRSMSDAWGVATQTERREMLRAIVDGVVCDPTARRIVALKPKPSFRLLFRQMRGLQERGEMFEIVL